MGGGNGDNRSGFTQFNDSLLKVSIIIIFVLIFLVLFFGDMDSDFAGPIEEYANAIGDGQSIGDMSMRSEFGSIDQEDSKEYESASQKEFDEF